MAVVQSVLRAAFNAGVILPARLLQPLLGEHIWVLARPVAAFSARNFGRLAGSVITAFSTDPLRASMVLTEIVEGAFGIEGDWEILDEKTAVRRVTFCPFAEPLRPMSKFCSVLGKTLGDAMLVAAARNRSIHFEIVSTLSEGATCCEYRVTLGDNGRA